MLLPVLISDSDSNHTHVAAVFQLSHGEAAWQPEAAYVIKVVAPATENIICRGVRTGAEVHPRNAASRQMQAAVARQ